MTKQPAAIALLPLLLLPATALSQDERGPEGSFIEFGLRGITGTVDNRANSSGVPFSNGFRPDILSSGINTYRDYRNSFYIPRSSILLDHVLATNSYFRLQTASNSIAFQGSTLSRDQSFVATLGHYGLYKLQFSWDQTPHIFSGTTRTLYTQSGPGVWRFTGNRAALDAGRLANTGAALFDALNQVAGNAFSDVQSTLRKTGSGLASWNINPNWNVAVFFSRQNQLGTRPHGMCFGNNPSCFWAEVPENLDYFTNTFKAATDFSQKAWEVQLGLRRQTFENNVPNMLVENPFSNNANSTIVSNTGNLSLYPNNNALNVLVGGALNLGRFHFMSSISPGRNSQNDRFVPYTTNSFLLSQAGAAAPIPLPASSLDGEVRTLAMNYTAVVTPFRNVELAARYRHYDHNNETRERVFNPWVNDISAEVQLAGPSGQEVVKFGGIGGVIDAECRGVCNKPASFHTRDVELSGTWFLGKKSSVKAQYARQWFDREHRDVEQTIEDTYKVAVDLKPARDFTFRISGARQNREPQDNDYEWFLLPGTQRPDEGFRRRNRVDALAQYDVTGRLSVSGFFGTTQDDFNHRSPLTSLTPLGDPSLVRFTSFRPTPSYGPYYVYGVLNDFGWNWGGDFDYLLSDKATVFGEYTRERSKQRQVSRQRSRNTASQLGCPSVVGANDCDPINDWLTLTTGIVDTYTVGTDLNLHKRLSVSMYYSLAASQGNSLTDGVNCQIGNGPNDFCRTNFPNWALDSATNRVVTFNFPETVTRLHEVDVFAKFQLTKNLYPKFEYRYERFDDKDYQTSVLNPNAYVGPLIDPAGTTGLQRMLFLGADTPGYKAHSFKATLEYHF